MKRKQERVKSNYLKVKMGVISLAALGVVATGVATKKIPVPLYQMERVVDGDTFVTTENQMIRIFGIDTPEISLCGGEEAKVALTRILKKSPFYMKIVYRDSGNRLYAMVYNIDGAVSNQLLAQGLAISNHYWPGLQDETRKIMDKAMADKVGIYSKKCTQKKNEAQPKCVIKGNIRTRGMTEDTPTYHFPGCGSYESTKVQLYNGDRWFCSEKEAKEAGFKKGADCFNRNWKLDLSDT